MLRFKKFLGLNVKYLEFTIKWISNFILFILFIYFWISKVD